MHLNPELLADSRNLTKAVDTIAHEGRHAYQHYAIEHPGFHPDAAQTSAWAANFHNYLTAEQYGFEAYRNQPVEADAWAFGQAIRDRLYGGQSA
jgi:hypothetical protein